ncbi:MAG: hypothetical protein U5R46_19760 [Gammaproteobacteria bacterium]|nr:hypothetical protein [Gammaproteobacteria bacterium]
MGRKQKKETGSGAEYGNNPKQVRIGVAWYTSEQWRSVRDSAADPEKLEATYEEWVTVAEDALKQIAEAGVIPEKVFVDAKEFCKWCRSSGRTNEASTRAQYASVLLRDKYQEDSN